MKHDPMKYDDIKYKLNHLNRSSNGSLIKFIFFQSRCVGKYISCDIFSVTIQGMKNIVYKTTLSFFEAAVLNI